MFRPEQFGRPFHGEFSSADASALSEANARFTLYGVDKQAITLAADERVIVTDIDVVVGTALTVTIYDGDDATPDDGEKILMHSFGANGGISSHLRTPHYCAVNASTSSPDGYPKLETSAAGQVDCVIHGVVVKTTVA